MSIYQWVVVSVSAIAFIWGLVGLYRAGPPSFDDDYTGRRID